MRAEGTLTFFEDILSMSEHPKSCDVNQQENDHFISQLRHLSLNSTLTSLQKVNMWRSSIA